MGCRLGSASLGPSKATVAAALVWAVNARLVEGFDLSWEPVPWGYHNLFVLIVTILTGLWVVKVTLKLWLVVTVRRRLATSPALPLERMSLYAEDFQRLIRQHFNQILRMRRTVPPRPVDRRTLSVHLQPESLEVICSGARLGLRFAVDTLAPCSVRLYWGVSVAACNDLLQHRDPDAEPPAASRSSAPRRGSEGRWAAALSPLLPQGPGPAAGASSVAPAGPGPMSGSLVEITERTAGSRLSSVAAEASAGGNKDASGEFLDIFAPVDAVLRSTPVVLPAGFGQRYETLAEDFIDRSRLPFNIGATWPVREGEQGAAVPLAIAVTSHVPPTKAASGSVEGKQILQARTQVSFVRFRSDATNNGLRGEVLHQLALGEDGMAHRLMGIYGFEAEGGDEHDCMICYDRRRSVLLFPCRHCSVCPTCLRSLRDERCPLCRSIFSAYILFPTGAP